MESQILDLDRLLDAESEDVEWKEGVADIEGVVETLAAFANDFSSHRRGGWVLCGIREEKDQDGFPKANPVGLTAARVREIEGKVLTKCRDLVTPGIVPRVVKVNAPSDSSRRILGFFVGPSDQAHSVRSKSAGQRFWIRMGPTTSEALNGLWQELLRKKGLLPPYLEQACPEAKASDLSRSVLEDFFNQAQLPFDLDQYLIPDVPITALARPLIVSRPSDGELAPTYLALLLFSKTPERFLRGAYVVFSIYLGLDRSVQHSQRQEIYGPLQQMLEQTLRLIELHAGVDIDKSYDVRSGLQNLWRFAKPALQESLVNALAHRDYQSLEPVRVTMFDDRIEISNPTAPGTRIDEKTLAQGRVRVQWLNPALAAFLLRMRLAQNEGQGLPTIFEQTLRLSGLRPEVRLENDVFRVVLPAQRRPAKPTADGDGEDGLIVISLGGPSILPAVTSSLAGLGLDPNDLLFDYVHPRYLHPEPEAWAALATELRRHIKPFVERSNIKRVHLFYRGPVVMAPLLGTLIAPTKPLWLYYKDESGVYNHAFTIDRRFLIGDGDQKA
jgi:ATP-dependent DNA helicase RecG